MKLTRVALALALLGPVLVSPVAAAQEGEASQAPSGTTVEVTAPVATKVLAVSITSDGETRGHAADLSVTVAKNGSGHVFMDTRPLAGTDMQGSARMAARVAASVTGFSMQAHDFYYVVRSPSPTVSGPSAGATMALATVVALQNAHLEEGEEAWNLSSEVLGTGTISPDGTIGPVGGILEKAEAARDEGASFFAVPAGQGTYTPRPVTQNGQPGEPVNVSEHCSRELSITCREVASIEELVRLATGHELEGPEVGEPPSTAQYEEILGPLSVELLERAEGYRDVWERLNGTDLRPEAEQAVRQAIGEADEAYQMARSLREDTRYYSSASRAFLSSIHGTHADLMLTYFEEGRSLDYVQDQIDRVDDTVAEARSAAGNATVEGMHDLYTVGAAQQRVSDAEQRIDQAGQRLDAREVRDALFDTAWASERSETVHWWLSLGDSFGTGPALPDDLDRLAGDMIDLADEILAYARQTLQSPTERASQTLQSAKQDADRGFHAAALVEAAEAQVQAALALEVRAGEPSSEKVNSSREQAAQAIQQARERGIEPMLAVAMFEFGGDQTDPVIQLEQFRTARVLAGLSSVLGGESQERASNYVGAWEPSETSHDSQPTTPQARAWAIGWFIVGMFTTIAAGAFVAGVVQRDEDGI